MNSRIEIKVKSFKGDANDWINGLSELQCRDPANTVVFALKRVEQE